MIGLAVVLLGLVLAIGGWVLLRRGGEGWRIGRLLAVAPQRSLAEVVASAGRDPASYVRVHGRIDSEEEFPGDDGAALVFRRRRLQRQHRHLVGGATWRTFDDQRLAVPFALAERGERVAIDVSALGDGLVVVPGLSTGIAADLAAWADAADGIKPDAPADGATPEASAAARAAMSVMGPETPVRLRVDQVATTDHATAAGVVTRSPEGEAILGPGLGRPLILTTLDLDEAMRVLGAEQRRTLLIAAGLLAAAALALALGALLLIPGVVAAAEPAATAAAELLAGDPRSSGEGPGLVGSPLLVLGAVVALGIGTALVTALLLRLTRRG